MFASFRVWCIRVFSCRHPLLLDRASLLRLRPRGRHELRPRGRHLLLLDRASLLGLRPRGPSSSLLSLPSPGGPPSLTPFSNTHRPQSLRLRTSELCRCWHLPIRRWVVVGILKAKCRFWIYCRTVIIYVRVFMRSLLVWIQPVWSTVGMVRYETMKVRNLCLSHTRPWCLTIRPYGIL